MRTYLVIAALFILFATGCTNQDRVADPTYQPIEGNWEDQYTITVPGLIEPGPDIIEYHMIARLSFTSTTFTLSTYRNTISEQTLKYHATGAYSISGDTIVFEMAGYSGYGGRIQAYPFNFSISRDQLSLAEIPVDLGDGYLGFSLISLPWRAGPDVYVVIGTKNSGTFSRLR